MDTLTGKGGKKWMNQPFKVSGLVLMCTFINVLNSPFFNAALILMGFG